MEVSHNALNKKSWLIVAALSIGLHANSWAENTTNNTKYNTDKSTEAYKATGKTMDKASYKDRQDLELIKTKVHEFLLTQS